MNEKIRAFIAIDFPDSVIKEVERVQKIVSKKKFDGKLIELENLHLTLKFLGGVEEEKLKEIEERLGRVEFSEMDLRLREVGLFSYKGNPRIVWIKVAGKGIFDLQKKIDDALEGLFEKEKRFMSHLTIARVKYVKDKSEFSNYVAGVKTSGTEFRVGGFKLMKSELQKIGPVYTMLKEFTS